VSARLGAHARRSGRAANRAGDPSYCSAPGWRCSWRDTRGDRARDGACRERRAVAPRTGVDRRPHARCTKGNSHLFEHAVLGGTGEPRDLERRTTCDAERARHSPPRAQRGERTYAVASPMPTRSRRSGSVDVRDRIECRARASGAAAARVREAELAPPSEWPSRRESSGYRGARHAPRASDAPGRRGRVRSHGSGGEGRNF